MTLARVSLKGTPLSQGPGSPISGTVYRVLVFHGVSFVGGDLVSPPQDRKDGIWARGCGARVQGVGPH